MEENLKHLKEVIVDEERIVTYISLSKELCIHVNEAKKILMEGVRVLRHDNPDIKLNINYVISGLSDDNQGQVVICSDEELQKRKDSFNIVFYVHIYSVNKGLNTFDKVALTSVNSFEDIPLCMGLVKNDFCFKHTTEEIGNLKTNSQEAVSSSNLQNVHKPLQKNTKPIKAPIISEHEIGNNKLVKTMDIEKMLDNNIKQEKPSPPKAEKITKSADKKSTSKTTKGISGFFSKSNGVSNTKICKTTNESIQVSTGSIEDKKTEIKQEKGVIVNDDKVTVKESTVNGTIHKKPKSVVKPNAKVDKKRKRVLHVSDSESDNEENDPFNEKMVVDNESDDEIPPTPTVNTVKITSGIVNPKKRRKVVDKTYTDEDGYILTKKEEVYESCSDNEEETAKKENSTTYKLETKIEISPKVKINKAAHKKKISPPQKGKQATMMNFFKKV